MVPGRERSSGPSTAVLGTAAGVLVVVLAVLAIVVVTTAGDDPSRGPTAPPAAGPESASPAGSGAATQSQSATPGASASPVLTPSPSPTAPSGPRPPTQADADAAAAAGQAESSAVVDLDGDATAEVVTVRRTGDAVQVHVLTWDGTAYGQTYRGDGGAADRPVELRVRDETADGTLEIVTLQSVGAQGASLSVWGIVAGVVRALPGNGGCWDGSHTYGVTGASLGDGTLTATCDTPGVPTAAFPSDVYVWDGTAFTYERTQEPG